MTRWGGLCPQCDHIKKRTHGPGRYPGPDRCPECNWPMNVVDLDIVDGEPDDNQELVTDGGRDAGHDGGVAHLSPGEPECSRCGMPPRVKTDDGDIIVACSCTELFVDDVESNPEWGDDVAV